MRLFRWPAVGMPSSCRYLATCAAPRQPLLGEQGGELLVAVCRAGRFGSDQLLQALEQLIGAAALLRTAGAMHKQAFEREHAHLHSKNLPLTARLTVDS